MTRILLAALVGAAVPGLLAAQSAPQRAPTRTVTASYSRAATADTTRISTSTPRPAEGVVNGQLTLDRERFSYGSDGRRDPFTSLMASGEIRPMISDVRLVGIVYAANGGSVAMLRDIKTNEQYRVRRGDPLGRMRVARIEPKQLTFIIEEFGFSRQETLTLADPTTPRTQQ